MIDELNEQVKCKLAPSKIHGVGVFAIRDIKEGEKMYCIGMVHKWYRIPYYEFQRLRPEIQELIIQRWPVARQNTPFLHPHSEAWLLSFMNHSDDPNYDKFNDTALKDIKAKEEVTENYN